MQDEELALQFWARATGELKAVLQKATDAIELHPSPVPKHWAVLIPQLRQLLVDFQEG